MYMYLTMSIIIEMNNTYILTDRRKNSDGKYIYLPMG